MAGDQREPGPRHAHGSASACTANAGCPILNEAERREGWDTTKIPHSSVPIPHVTIVTSP